jgi:hypothetical protein
MIGRKRAAVDVVEVLFDDDDLDADAMDQRLAAAIAGARLPPPVRGSGRSAPSEAVAIPPRPRRKPGARPNA